MPVSNLYAVWTHIPAELVQRNAFDPACMPRRSPSPGMRVKSKGWSFVNMDIVVLAIVIGFFALTLGYVGACEKL